MYYYILRKNIENFNSQPTNILRANNNSCNNNILCDFFFIWGHGQLQIKGPIENRCVTDSIQIIEKHLMLYIIYVIEGHARH